MRTYLLSITVALTLFTIATSAHSKDIHIGPGGVKTGSSYGHHRYYNRLEASTIVTKANDVVHCGQFARIKKNYLKKEWVIAEGFVNFAIS
jgi:hypothetical protein